MTGKLLAQRLSKSRIVKAFDSIAAWDLDKGRPARAPNHRAQPIASDDPDAKALVIQLLDPFGFDTVAVGPLTENRRLQKDTPSYREKLGATTLRAARA